MKLRLNFCEPFIVFLLIIFASAVYIMRAHVAWHFYGDTDFFKFYQSVRFYFAGQNLYDPTIMEVKKETCNTWLRSDGNLNPPFFTLLLLPLYYFNYANALEIWTLISLLCLFAGVLLVLRPFIKWHKYTLLILCAFIIYIPNSANLGYGQVTNYLLVLLAGAFLWGRQHKDIRAGILIGIACAMKMFCGLFLIYFLCIKRFRLLISSIITGAVAFMSSILVFGVDNYFHYRAVLKKIGWYSGSWNASFYGFFLRLFSTTEKNRALISVPHLAEILTILCSGLLLFYLVYNFSYNFRKLDQPYFDIGYSLTIIAMLLISPLGWIYYFGLLIIPYLVLISEAENTRYSLTIPLSAVVCIFLSTLSGNYISTSGIKTLSEIFVDGGMGFYALMGMLILYIFLIREKLCKYKIENPPKQMIALWQWKVIYSVAFFPSIMSLFLVAKHVVENFG